MSWFSRNFMMPVVALMVLLLASSIAQAEDPPKMTNLRLPLEIHENGKVKTQVTAGSADISESGQINATDVKIEMFSKEGALEATVLAESCYVDRDNEIITSETKINFERQGLKISGRGFEWNGEKQTFKILHQAKVAFQSKSIQGLNELKQ